MIQLRTDLGTARASPSAIAVQANHSWTTLFCLMLSVETE